MLKCFLCVLGCVTLARSYNILLVFPTPGKSHGILGDGYVRSLLNAGHEVTYATPYPKRDAQPKLKIVDLSANFVGMQNYMLNMEKLINKEVDLGSQIISLLQGYANLTLSNPNLQALMMDPKVTFDLVIAEWLFSDAYSGFAPIFQAPYIVAAPMEPNWMMLQLMDDMPNPSYTVDLMSSETTPLSFVQRAKQLLLRIVGLYMKNVKMVSEDEEVYTKYFTPAAKARGLTLPSFSDAKFNASMMLANSHVSLGEPMALPQNTKAVGGFHIDPDVKPLPQDLQKIMDSAEHGVIYFSMGSTLKSTSLPDSIKKDLFRLFGKLKQTLLWKFEDDALTDIPRNVHILKWAPQPSILNHPNIKLFITHGGLLSTTEAIHFGVPIVGLPVFGDHFLNVGRAAGKGFALKVDWSYEVGAELETAVMEILGNPEYTNRVKELSFVYHDRLVSPAVELAHWARHVIETRGAPLLRSPALGLTWYQRYYVDLALVLIAIVLLVCVVVKSVLKKVCGSKQKVKRN